MLNDFQKALIDNKEVAWKIIKVYHPDIQEEYPNKYKQTTIKTLDRLEVVAKFDWVCIKLMAQHIKVSLGICFECNLSSGPKPYRLFEKELENNKFYSWRFIDDSKFKRCDVGYTNLEHPDNNEVNRILNEHQIPKPTAQQMYDYYHD